MIFNNDVAILTETINGWASAEDNKKVPRRGAATLYFASAVTGVPRAAIAAMDMQGFKFQRRFQLKGAHLRNGIEPRPSYRTQNLSFKGWLEQNPPQRPMRPLDTPACEQRLSFEPK
jgi:hypothetical protein